VTDFPSARVTVIVRSGLSSPVGLSGLAKFSTHSSGTAVSTARSFAGSGRS
jgi:hypothetical protein